jgi:type I restriction enzyme, S subunit
VSEIVALGDVADVVAGVGFPKDMQGGQGGAIPVFKVGDISAAWLQGKSLLNDSRNYLSAKEAKSLGKCLPAGATVFAKIGEALRLNRRVMLGRDALVDNNVMGLVPKRERVAPKYLYYFMQTVDLGGLSRSTTVPSIRKSDVVEISIPVPALAAQDEIVAELEKQFSRLDEAVANLQRVKANLKRYKASVLKAAVEGRLVETEAALARREGRTFETGEQLLQRILEERRVKWAGKGKYKEPIAPTTDQLPELPEGWTWATMPQLGELNRGKSKHRPRDDQTLYGGPYPFIQTGDVRRSDGSITEFTQTYSELGLSQSRLWPPGTLCITIAANIAETGILKLKACFPDSVVGFIPHLGSPTVEYVECFIRTARDGLDRFASATAQKNINLEVLEAVAVPTPPLAEQVRIVTEVDRHLSIIREVEAEVDANLQRAQALRQATLRAAFGGCS